MRGWYRWLGLLTCGLVLMAGLTGCHRHKRREIKVHEEQRVGEVREVPPGEMIVE